MLRLGYRAEDNTPVELTLDERRQGTYIIGTTGTGKSTLLKNIIYQDMVNDREHGMCVIDPHGDLIDDLLPLVPKDRVDDVILFDPMETDFPIGLNLLACDPKNSHEVRWMISNMIGTLQRIFESWGPRLEHVLRHILLTTLEFPQATMLELSKLLFTSKEERIFLSETLKDPRLRRFWKTFPYSERLVFELISSTLNKLTPFTTDDMMHNIVGQPENKINFQEIMDEGKILFVNLSKGDLGETNSKLLGSVIVNLILMAAMKRRGTPEKDRKAFHLIVDEFQNFATESFSILQSEARKYGVDVVVAHQYRDQLDLVSKGSTLNVGNMIIFRSTGRDSYELASQFDNSPPAADTRVEPIYQEYEFRNLDVLIETKLNTNEGKLFQEVELPRRPYNDVEAEMANRLSILPNYEARCRLIQKTSDGERPKLVEEHILTENLTDKKGDPAIAKRIKKNSQKLGRPKAEVEKEIRERKMTIGLFKKTKYSTAERLDDK